MEVCTVERGNKYTKKLNPDQVAEALKCEHVFLISPFRGIADLNSRAI
jgi:hypothetical protein